MFIVEWCDEEGELHELTFDNRADAYTEAARLEKDYGPVAVFAQYEVD